MLANLGAIMCYRVSCILAAHALSMTDGECQTPKICGLPSKIQKLCRTHLAFVVAAVAAVIAVVAAAVVGLCYTV